MEQLTKKDILKIITIIQKTYQGSYKFDQEDDLICLIEVWENCFSGYDRTLVFEAFKNSLKYCVKAPVISDIIRQINTIQEATQKSDYELWGELEQAINMAGWLSSKFRYTYIPDGSTKTQGELAKKEFADYYNSLDPLIRDYLGRKEELLNLSTYSDLEYEKGRFLKAIPNLKHRQKIIKDTPQFILNTFKKTDLLLEKEK